MSSKHQTTGNTCRISMTLLIFFTSSFANFSNSRTFWTFSIAHTKEKAWIVTLTQTNACGREEIALLQADGRVLRRGYVPRFVRTCTRTYHKVSQQDSKRDRASATKGVLMIGVPSFTPSRFAAFYGQRPCTKPTSCCCQGIFN
jgi:hypothetical protein